MKKIAPRFPAKDAIQRLRDAARLNRDDPLRVGSLLHFPNYGQLVMTGDMHGHLRHFDKLQRFAALHRMASRHVILHELIHEENIPGQIDGSFELMIAAADYKCQFPEQVHFLQSNHELAQLMGQHISKGGQDVVQYYADAVTTTYGRGDGEEVLAAMLDMIESYPLAARTPNRVWMSHSLPNEYEVDFDPAIVRRSSFEPDDRRDGGSVYQLVWGRDHTPALLHRLAEAWDVDYFIIGHQPQESGHVVLFERLFILASENPHGAFLPFDLSKPQTAESLSRNIRKFVEVA